MKKLDKLKSDTSPKMDVYPAYQVDKLINKFEQQVDYWKLSFHKQVEASRCLINSK